MGPPRNASPPHLYSQQVQLKLYQAFIFSIPILFSIILFLLFYLFYLKRRAYTLSSPPPILPRTLNRPTSSLPLTSEMGLKGEVTDKLPVVLVDEDLRARDLQCCVCLGEFEMEEELGQVPSCKHVFHVDCIVHWLQSNSTCPLCRCSIDDHAPAPTKFQFGHPVQPPTTPPPPVNGGEEDPQPQGQQDHDDHFISNLHHQQRLPSEQQQSLPPPPTAQPAQDSIGLNFTNHSRELPVLIATHGPSSTITTCSTEPIEVDHT